MISSMHVGSVRFNREISPGHYVMSVALADGFETPLPGQFVMIRFPNRLDPLLGRPLSVYGFEKFAEGGAIEFLYRVAGKGTSILSGLREGDKLEVLGPLGKGFSTPPSVKHAVIVAGGIGVAPVTYLAYHFRHHVSPLTKITCYLGSKSMDCLVGLERLQDICSEVIVTTDDGTAGTCGFVTDAFSRDLEFLRGGDTQVYACGPLSMMKCLADALLDGTVACEVSLEERMACGVGACLGCAVSLRSPVDKHYYGRVCKDGPVFDIRNVNWGA